MPNQATYAAVPGQFGQPVFAPGVIPAGATQPVFAQAILPAGQAPQASPILSTAPSNSYVTKAGILDGGPSCDVGCVEMIGCDGRCGGGCADCCDSGGFNHCWYFFGEVLYLRPRDSEMAWAAPIDGPIVPGPINNNPIQISPFGVADMDFQAGWRGGFQYNLSECTGISARYTMFESNTTDTVEVTAPNVIRSLVSHPGTQTAAQDFLAGTAVYNIDFDQLDIDYKKLLAYDCNYQFGYHSGFSIVQMQQTFVADFAGTGTEHVETDIDFYGAGGRFGLFGEMAVNPNWRLYGRGTGNLIAGEFRADYFQGQNYDPQVVDTHWHGGRIIGIWDLEAGVKRTSRCGNYSINVGYMFSAWTNTLQTDEWIRGVHDNSPIGMDDTMTFDGLVARFDARF
jgi:hypothetical protein